MSDRSWCKNCNDCHFLHRPTSTCYRDRDAIRVVEDPSVHQDWCPQETYDRLPARGQHPYFEATCEGCRWKKDNHALAPFECQNHLCFPQSAESGECPMKGVDAMDLWQGSDDEGLIPMVTARYADIIARGINEGDFSFWGVDGIFSTFKLDGMCSGGQIRGFHLRQSRGRMLASLRQMDCHGFFDMTDLSVNRAVINGRGEVLSLFTNFESEWTNDGRMNIMICPVGTPGSRFFKGVISAEDDEEEECEECRPVVRPKVASLEDFL